MHQTGKTKPMLVAYEHIVDRIMQQSAGEKKGTKIGAYISSDLPVVLEHLPSMMELSLSIVRTTKSWVSHVTQRAQ